jgi:hypothetical protein
MLCCFSQKMAQKAPKKKIPSTASDVMRYSLKVQEVPLHQWLQGPVGFVLNKGVCIDCLLVERCLF